MAEIHAEINTYALEGLPFAGKSSCGRYVAKRGTNTLLLADYHDLLPAETGLAQVPDSISEQQRRIEMYLELDRQRWQQVLCTTTSHAVLDRCHVSLMAYAIALEPWIGTSASRESMQRIQWALTSSAHPLRAPTWVFYLEMSAQTASDRAHTHATTMQGKMRTVEFAQRLIDSYEHVLANIESEVVRYSSEQPLSVLQAEVEDAMRVRRLP